LSARDLAEPYTRLSGRTTSHPTTQSDPSKSLLDRVCNPTALAYAVPARQPRMELGIHTVVALTGSALSASHGPAANFPSFRGPHMRTGDGLMVVALLLALAASSRFSASLADSPFIVARRSARLHVGCLDARRHPLMVPFQFSSYLALVSRVVISLIRDRNADPVSMFFACLGPSFRIFAGLGHSRMRAGYPATSLVRFAQNAELAWVSTFPPPLPASPIVFLFP